MMSWTLAGLRVVPRETEGELASGGELTLAAVVVVLLVVASLVGARIAWRTPPEELDERPMPVPLARAGLAGIPAAAGWVTLWFSIASTTWSQDAGDSLGFALFVVGAAALVVSFAYSLAYFFLRLPDALLPPPQRDRGGQWHDRDGRPVR